MNIKPRTVLVIEDDLQTARILAQALFEFGYHPVLLFSYQHAFNSLKKLAKEKLLDIVGIIFDHDLDDNQNSQPLVEIMVDLGYKGIMLANSARRKCNEDLLRLGCTHIRPGHNKETAVEYLNNLLLS